VRHFELIQHAVTGIKHAGVKRRVSGSEAKTPPLAWIDFMTRVRGFRIQERSIVSNGVSKDLHQGLQLATEVSSFAGAHAPPALNALSTPNQWNGKVDPNVTCYNCNEKGHMANVCTEKKPDQVCWRCCTSAHRVPDCTVKNHKVTGKPFLVSEEVYAVRDAAFTTFVVQKARD